MALLKEEIRIILPFFTVQFFGALFALTVAYRVIYLTGIGLTLFQVSLLIAISLLTTVFFDVPTGAVADIYGRKFSVITSLVLSGVILILIPFFESFFGLLFLFFSWGIAKTLSSGADQAWVLSNIGNNKKLVQKYYIFTFVLMNIAIIIGPLIAALLVKKYGMAILWIIQGTATIIIAFFAMFITENFRSKKTFNKKIIMNTYKQTKSSFLYSFKNLQISKLTFAWFFVMAFAGIVGFLWQPYLQTFSVPLIYYGIITSIAGLLSVVAPFAAQVLSKQFNKVSKYLSSTITVFVIVLLSIFFIKSIYPAILIVILLFIGIQFIAPIEAGYFQEFIPDKMKATILSLKSTAGTLGSGLVVLLIGFVADIFGPKISLASSSLLLLPAFYLYYTLKQ